MECGWLNPRILFTKLLLLKCQNQGLAFNQNKEETTQTFNFFTLFLCVLTLIVTKHCHEGGAMLIEYADLIILHVVCRFDQYVASLTIGMATSLVVT